MEISYKDTSGFSKSGALDIKLAESARAQSGRKTLINNLWILCSRTLYDPLQINFLCERSLFLLHGEI